MSEDDRSSIWKAINAPISNINLYLPGKGTLIDAVEYRLSIDKDIKSNSKHKSMNGNSRSEHIYRRLGHIIVNPNNPYSREALTNTYVYKDVFNREKISKEFPNLNENSAYMFVEDLKLKAEITSSSSSKIFKIDQTAQQHGLAPIILIGNRGIGKTYFLNHLLAKFNKYFDENKIMWIRINLIDKYYNDYVTSQYLDDSELLLHWIYAQNCKIVFRYYNTKSDYFADDAPKKYPLNLINEMYSFIDSLPDQVGMEEKNYLKEKVTNWIQVFMKYGQDEPLSPALVSMLLGREVFRLTQAAGYSHIIVLDGMDRLDITNENKLKFDKLLGQIHALTMRGDLKKAAYLLVMRSNTLANNPIPFHSNADDVRKLDNVSLQNIVSVRLRYIESEVSKIMQSADVDDPSWQSADWPGHIEDFEAYLFNEIETKNGYLEDLEDVFIANRRAQVQTLQLNYYEYLNRKKDKPYILLESITKSGFVFPPKTFKYQLTGGVLGDVSRNEFSYDNYFLPSIFMCPYAGIGMLDNAEQKIPYESILMGLRICQLLIAHDKRIEMQDGFVERLQVGELISICITIFRYRENMLRAMLEEMIEYEYINVSGNEGFTHASTFYKYKIYTMPKMIKVIKVFMKDIAYLGLAAMRLPINISVLNKSNARIPFIYAGTIDKDILHGHSFRGKEVVQWTITKIINSISACRLMAKINEKEEIYAKNKIDVLSNKRSIKTVNFAIQGTGGKGSMMFEYVNDLKISIADEIINGILPSLTTHKKIIETSIDNYISEWC